MGRRGTIKTSAEEAGRRLGLPDTTAALLWCVDGAPNPNRGVKDRPIDRELKHPLEYLELLLSALVSSAITLPCGTR